MRWILLLAIAALPAVGLSAGCPFAGFYVGAAIGPGTNMADFESATSATYDAVFGDDDVVLNASRVDAYQTQTWGEIYAGWGKSFCNRFYLGGRFGINFSSFGVMGTNLGSQTDPEDEVYTAALTDVARARAETVEYTLDFKPGIIWCDRTMIFGIIGAAFNRVALDATSDFLYIFLPDPTEFPATLNIHNRKDRVGFRGGFGLEQMLTPCISVHLAWVYTDYGHVSGSAVGDTETQVGVQEDGHVVAFKAKLHRQVTSIGLSYYF